MQALQLFGVKLVGVNAETRHFDRAGIGVASGIYEVVGMPLIKVQMVSGNGASLRAAPAMEQA
ncbi:MAG: hypothetical protein ACR2IV_21145 [Bryobacteraceae bacterium]